MNSKTTIVLLFLVVLVVGAVLVFRGLVPEPTVPEVASPVQANVKQPLIDEDFGEVATITVRVEGKPEWRFERARTKDDQTSADWMIAAPFEGKAQKWQVDSIARQLTEAKYTVKYDKGSPSAVAADVGLDPPRVVVVLATGEGKELEIRIGRTEGDRGTYVTLGDGGDVYRIEPSLQHLLKQSVLEYRDNQLFGEFATEDIVRIEVTDRPEDGDPTTYELVKTGTDWLFDKPTKAKGMGDKIRKLCSSFAALRATAWTDADVEDLAVYGLEPGSLTVSVTTEELPEVQDANTNGEPEPVPVTKHYTVHFSRIGPIGESNKVYVRRGDQRLVGTVTQSIAETFQPDMKEWRDNRLTDKNVTLARKLELKVGSQAATFVRTGANWSYDPGGEPADAGQLKSLLDKIRSIKVVNSVEGALADPARFGLDDPQGELTLVFDGDSDPVRITVGGFTDADAKRLVYVRCGDGDSVAKVRVADTRVLCKEPTAYRDRTVVNIKRDRFEVFSIDRPAQGSMTSGGTISFTLAKQDDQWRVTEPVAAEADTGQVDRLLDMLSKLTALEVVDTGGDLSPFGLDAPQIRLGYTFLPPVIHRIEPEGPEETNDGEPTTQQVKMVTKPYQPPAETYTLLVSSGSGKVYAAREENPQLAYLLTQAAYDCFMAEYRRTDLFSFEIAQVTGVSLEGPEQTRAFEKTDSGWVYAQESDLPIDDKKMTNYLLRIDNLAATRFVAYDVADLSPFGLDVPEYELTVTLGEASSSTLLVSASSTGSGERFAKMADSGDVFVLPSDVIDRIQIDVAQFEQTE